MLGRGIAALPEIEPVADNVWGQVNPQILTGNLECVIAESGPRHPHAHAHFRCPPSRARAFLKRFHVVNLANNHSYDFLDQGLESTQRTLQTWGVGTVGAGADAKAAREPFYLHREGAAIAFFGATTVANPPPGGQRTWHLAKPDDEFFAAVRSASTDGAFIVVHLHAGQGDFRHPSPATRALHRRLAAAGADVVFGHHPHIVQGWERIESTLLFYSLGDFVFDDPRGERGQSLVVSIDLSQSPPMPFLRVAQRTQDLRVVLMGGAREQSALASVEQRNLELLDGRWEQEYLRELRSSMRSLAWEGLRKDWVNGGFPMLMNRAKRMNVAKLRLLTSALFQRKHGPRKGEKQ